MRAKTVNSKCYIFDFDETLVKSNAKIRIYKNNRLFKTLSPDEFNYYKKQPEDTIDASDFKDPRILLKSKKYKMWPLLKNVYSAIKQGRLYADIYILTGRSQDVKKIIHLYLDRENINIPLENVITIGSDKWEINIPEEKKKVLKNLSKKYSEIYFFDDNPNSIEPASKIPNIKTWLVDWNI